MRPGHALHRRFLRVAGGLALAGLLLPGAMILREYHRDPWPLLDQPLGVVRIARAEARAWTSASGEARRLVEFELEGVPEGPVRGALSLPEGPLGRLPTVVILGGLDVGRESLRYVEAHGPNALIAYEYPRTAEGERAPSPVLRLPRIRRAALAVPVQVQALLAWTRSQPWSDPGRISLLGYSFGAMFVPASARLAEARGPSLRALVMAFGGADLPALLAANAQFRPAALRRPAAWAAGALVRPLEPALHLPRLRTEALFVTGLRDDRIPLACARRMQALKPIPRSVLDLDEGHMDPGLPERNRRIVGASQAWLVSRGALAPAP